MESEADGARHVQRVAEAATVEAARALFGHGFDEARADGANLVLRRGKTTWRVINRVRHRPGIRTRVQQQLARFVISNLVSRSPATERRS